MRARCLLLALSLPLASCKKSPASTAAAGASTAPAASTTAPASRGPLKNIASVYDVTYTPETVVLSADIAQHHLKTASADGATFTFDAASSDVRALKPGSVMLLTGVALRRVTQVQPLGDSIVVATGDAEITDAIKDGTIQAQTSVDFGSVVMGPGPAHTGRDPLDIFSLVTPAYADTTTTTVGGPGSFSVKIDPFQYSVKFTAAADRLNIDMAIQNTVDNMSVTSSGYLKNYQAVVNILIKDKTITKLDFQNSGLDGEMVVNWTAATVVAGPLTKIASWSDLLKKYQPLRQAAFTFPFLIGPIPFSIKFSTGITFTPAFTSKNSICKGSMTVHYSGSGGFTVNNGNVQSSGQITQPTQANPKTQILSLGPIGFTVAVEFPRAELGMGTNLFTFSPTAYVNAISSFGLVYGGPAAMLPCETHILDVTVNTGISAASTMASFFGTASKLTFAKQLYDRNYKGPAAPGGMMCPT
jgi:hypothetical protein